MKNWLITKVQKRYVSVGTCNKKGYKKDASCQKRQEKRFVPTVYSINLPADTRLTWSKYVLRQAIKTLHRQTVCCIEDAHATQITTQSSNVQQPKGTTNIRNHGRTS